MWTQTPNSYYIQTYFGIKSMSGSWVSASSEDEALEIYIRSQLIILDGDEEALVQWQLIQQPQVTDVDYGETDDDHYSTNVIGVPSYGSSLKQKYEN